MHKIRLQHEKMHFSSAHFVLGADYCEGLHGHNYQVEVNLSGPLNAHGMVMDFGDLKDRVAKVCTQLDHKVILPGSSEEILIEKKGSAILVNVKAKHYEFPAEDCVILPIRATTAEILAQYIANELNISSKYNLEVCVGETPSSRGCFSIS